MIGRREFIMLLGGGPRGGRMWRRRSWEPDDAVSAELSFELHFSCFPTRLDAAHRNYSPVKKPI